MRLIIAFYFGTQSQFQSTHPLRGATSWRFQFLSRSADFNPRTPCGVRPGLESISLPQSTFQSTHPLRGATAIFNRVEFDTFTFQSTHPLRGATKTRRRLGRSLIFQSTHPLRGATYVGDRLWTPSRFQSTHPLRGATHVDFVQGGRPGISIHAPLAGCDYDTVKVDESVEISIHAPLAGCDAAQTCEAAIKNRFQSTHPLRGATMVLEDGKLGEEISIHAPLAGCDQLIPAATDAIIISIHAPLAGCDMITDGIPVDEIDFNPRTPCGVRHMQPPVTMDELLFQSTHPLRGATYQGGEAYEGDYISIHAPLAGCDHVQRRGHQGTDISIHAPLAGCDMLAFDGQTQTFKFQSTHPLRGATRPYQPRRRGRDISIHAPLAGCDSKIAEIFPAILRKSYKISAKPNKERRCRVLGKGKAAAISDLARCEPPGENRNASGSHQTISAPSGS